MQLEGSTTLGMGNNLNRAEGWVPRIQANTLKSSLWRNRRNRVDCFAAREATNKAL